MGRSKTELRDTEHLRGLERCDLTVWRGDCKGHLRPRKGSGRARRCVHAHRWQYILTIFTLYCSLSLFSRSTHLPPFTEVLLHLALLYRRPPSFPTPGLQPLSLSHNVTLSTLFTLFCFYSSTGHLLSHCQFDPFVLCSLHWKVGT